MFLVWTNLRHSPCRNHASIPAIFQPKNTTEYDPHPCHPSTTADCRTRRRPASLAALRFRATTMQQSLTCQGSHHGRAQADSSSNLMSSNLSNTCQHALTSAPTRKIIVACCLGAGMGCMVAAWRGSERQLNHRLTRVQTHPAADRASRSKTKTKAATPGMGTEGFTKLPAHEEPGPINTRHRHSSQTTQTTLINHSCTFTQSSPTRLLASRQSLPEKVSEKWHHPIVAFAASRTRATLHLCWCPCCS